MDATSDWWLFGGHLDRGETVFGHALLRVRLSSKVNVRHRAQNSLCSYGAQPAGDLTDVPGVWAAKTGLRRYQTRARSQ